MKLSRSGASIVASLAVPAAGLLLSAQLAACGGSEAAPSSSSDASSSDGAQGANDATTDATQGFDDGSPGSSDAAQSSGDASDATVRGDASNDSGAGDSAPEGSADASADVVTKAADAANDVEVADATGDVQVGDAAMSGDASPDAGTQSEGGVTCPVAVPAAANYLTDLASVVCQSLQTCCGLSSAQFNESLCLSTYNDETNGGWMNVGLAQRHLASGRVGYDPAVACQCLSGTTTINCGLVSSGTWDGLASNCAGALPGSVALGGSCASSYECASDGYCTAELSRDPIDAAAGTCTALLPLNGACTNSAQCASVAAGSPSAYCDTTTTHECQPSLGTGATCVSSSDCASNICSFSPGTGFTCSTGIVFSDPKGSGGTCDYFTNPDAGATGH